MGWQIPICHNFPRGLRTLLHYCVALPDLMKSQPSKPSQPSQPFFPRGLRPPRYRSFALRAFWNLNFLNSLNPLNLLNLLNPLNFLNLLNSFLRLVNKDANLPKNKALPDIKKAEEQYPPHTKLFFIFLT